MIEVTNLTAQTLQPGQSVAFENVLLKSNCGAECFNKQIPTSIKLKVCGAIYEAEFNGNITAPAAGLVQLAITLGGSPLIETAMTTTIPAANDYMNVSTGTYIRTCCSDAARISVTNTGTTPVTLAANANFRVRRVA